jgi:aspartyl-tRNA synthetase
VFFAAGPVRRRGLLGAARLEIGKRCGLIDESAWSFLWVVDAPLFEPAGEDDDGDARSAGPGRRCTTRSPRPSRVDRPVRADPGEALAYAYDIVCNGNEIGGGSIRIHRRDVQERVFDGDGHRPARRRRRSSASCSTRSSSAPRRTAASPSAGTGSARCCSAPDSIRDVIAFPKSGGGYDPLTGAPAPITAQQRKEAGIDARMRCCQRSRMAGSRWSRPRPRTPASASWRRCCPAACW